MENPHQAHLRLNGKPQTPESILGSSDRHYMRYYPKGPRSISTQRPRLHSELLPRRHAHAYGSTRLSPLGLSQADPPPFPVHHISRHLPINFYDKHTPASAARPPYNTNSLLTNYPTTSPSPDGPPSPRSYPSRRQPPSTVEAHQRHIGRGTPRFLHRLIEHHFR